MNKHSPLILDVAGLELNAADRLRLKHPLTGGLILFSRNFASRAQLEDLCAQIKSERADALICVDHEGGRVQRFRKDGFTHLPPMRLFGDMWDEDEAKKSGSGALRSGDCASAAAYVLASELRACGVDFSFTPVLDLDFGQSAVIGNRAFHRDPKIVTQLARSLALGLLQAGMQHCAKHFPGHGFVAADSHTELPVDERSLQTILADDAAPYEWLQNTLSAVMPAHVIYPQIDDRPAGFSKTWLQIILRERLQFQGAIFSDDLSMEAARRLDHRLVSFSEAAVVALNAGCDLVLLCNQSIVDEGRAIDELLDDLGNQAENDFWIPNASSEARRLSLLPQKAAPTWDELMQETKYLQALEKIQSKTT